MQLKFSPQKGVDEMIVTGEYWYNNKKQSMLLEGEAMNRVDSTISLTREKDGKTREWFYGDLDKDANIVGNWAQAKNKEIELKAQQ